MLVALKFHPDKLILSEELLYNSTNSYSTSPCSKPEAGL